MGVIVPPATKQWLSIFPTLRRISVECSPVRCTLEPRTWISKWRNTPTSAALTVCMSSTCPRHGRRRCLPPVLSSPSRTLLMSASFQLVHMASVLCSNMPNTLVPSTLLDASHLVASLTRSRRNSWSPQCLRPQHSSGLLLQTSPQATQLSNSGKLLLPPSGAQRLLPKLLVGNKRLSVIIILLWTTIIKQIQEEGSKSILVK